MTHNAKQNSISWHEAERQIQKEAEWLKNVILPSPFKKDISANHCLNCLYRKIAILIVRGDVTARDYPNLDWSIKEDNKDLPKSRHGKEWHKNMMDTVGNYFSAQDFRIEQEPGIAAGRADLGVYKKGNKDLLIEVGSVSVLKLFINLSTLHNARFLLIPDEKHAIEFETY